MAVDSITLETERLILRPLQQTDAARVQELAGDARIAATTLAIPHPYEDGFAEKYIEETLSNETEGRGFTRAIVLKESGELIGVIGLGNTPERPSAMTGYWIGCDYWNRGYASEALRSVVQHGFEAMGLECIHANVFTGNEQSARVQEKAGLRYEGTMRARLIKNGVLIDLEYRSILRDEYKTLLTAGLYGTNPA